MSDRKLQVDDGVYNLTSGLLTSAIPNGIVDYYNADVVTANDYYPFGSRMAGRNFSAAGYRYGFNGQEKSDDVTAGNYTAEYWEYDSRIGRRWNLDPVQNDWESPYAVMSNNPIWNIDPNGDNDTTATSLNSAQFKQAVSMGFNEVVTNSNKKVNFHKEGNREKMLANLENDIDNYASSNNLTLQQGLDMQQVAKSYFSKFADVNDWSLNTMNAISSTLNSKSITDEWKIGISNYLVGLQSWKWGAFWGLVENTVYTIASAGYVSGRSAGAGPRGAFKSNTQKQIVESQAGVKFTETTIQRYVNPGRTVNSSDLRRAINGKPFSDPQGSGASAYYTTILRNGKSCNLKVVYNQETNTIFHFHYSRQAMGPLPKIPK